jgi:hypothetical protein
MASYGFALMEDYSDPFKPTALLRLQLFIHLIPVFGLMPSLWVLSRRTSDRHLRRVSRQTVTLGVLWGLGWLALSIGAGEVSSPSLSLGLMITTSAWTSTYFLTLLWMMARLWKRQSLEIPGVSQVANHLP